MKHGLERKELQILIRSLTQHSCITEALIFGSRALGTHKKASDIDIALKGSLSLSLIAKLKDEFEESNLPYSCDIVSYERASLSLQKHIDKYGITIYPSP